MQPFERVNRTASPIAPSDLGPELQQTLAALADVETRYEIERERLDRWSGPSPFKTRLLARLEARRLTDRQPLVHRLADLQREMMATLMFGRVGRVH